MELPGEVLKAAGPRLPCPQGDVDVTRMSPWLLRIEMARDMMVDKKLLLSEVGGRELGCA